MSDLPDGTGLPPDPRVAGDHDPGRPTRVGLLLAAGATVLAIPVLLALQGEDGGDDGPAPSTVVTVQVPVDRPSSGPPKGVSVVTSSTTSSTLPITTSTTSTTTVP